MKLVLLVLLSILPAFGQDDAGAGRGGPRQALSEIRKEKIPDYHRVTVRGRLSWFATSTAGPVSLLINGPFRAGLGTLRDSPHEYDTHWEGFGQRYGMRLTGISTGNAIEATVGSLWGEDPRYFLSPQHGFRSRTKYVIRSTFLAPREDGHWHPAYARYIGNVGNNFLSNTWRVPSERGPGDAAVRCVWGVASQMANNAFLEFWPDVKRKVFGK